MERQDCPDEFSKEKSVLKTEILRITKTGVHDGELRDNGSEWEGDTCVIKYSSDPLLLSVCLPPSLCGESRQSGCS